MGEQQFSQVETPPLPRLHLCTSSLSQRLRVWAGWATLWREWVRERESEGVRGGARDIVSIEAASY